MRKLLPCSECGQSLDAGLVRLKPDGQLSHRKCAQRAHEQSTPEECVKSAHVLHYELKMLVGTARSWRSTQEQVTANALIESFAVHARALVDFFFPRNTGPTSDLMAEAFFGSRDKWENARGQPSPALEDVRGRASKLVAHMTSQRLEILQSAKDWDYAGILRGLERLARQFLNTAPRERLSEDSRTDLEAVIREMASPLAISPATQPMVTSGFRPPLNVPLSPPVAPPSSRRSEPAT